MNYYTNALILICHLDQIGETDELNLGRIFDENALESLNDDEKSQNEDANSENTTTNVQEKIPEMNKKEAQPNIEDQTKSAVEQKQSTADKAETEAVPNEEDDNSDIFRTEAGWNDEMRRFYNDSWGGETFSVKNIRARMPSKSTLFDILVILSK